MTSFVHQIKKATCENQLISLRLIFHTINVRFFSYLLIQFYLEIRRITLRIYGEVAWLSRRSVFQAIRDTKGYFEILSRLRFLSTLAHAMLPAIILLGL